MNDQTSQSPTGPFRATRRDLLKAGGLAGLACLPGLGADLLPGAATTRRPSGFGRAESCLVVFLGGGPSHLDTFDPKPDAPAEFRGEFRSIATRAPGVRLSEHLPGLARCAGLFTVVRSLSHEDDRHEGAVHRMMTGHALPEDASSRRSCPHLGSALAASPSASPGRGGPAFVTVPGPLDAFGPVRPGQDAGRLGERFDPVVLRALPGLSAPGPSSEVPEHDDLLRRAADLGAESPRMLDRYGRNLFGRSALIGRRLVEAGTRFVQVNWVRHLDGGWDTHSDGFRAMSGDLLPTFDRAASSLLEDMASSGLLDRTLVVVMGEFGRDPRVNATAGRDHWPRAFSALVAGAGLPGGRAFGATDRLGAFPADRPVSPGQLAATIRLALGDASLGQAADERPIHELWDATIA